MPLKGTLTAVVAVAALPAMERFATAVVLATIRGAVPVVTVEVICPVGLTVVAETAARVPLPNALGAAQLTSEFGKSPLVSCGMLLPVLPTVYVNVGAAEPEVALP